MVIGICHSRTSHTWQYLISNQVLDVLSTLTFYLIICTGMLLLLQKKFAAMHLEHTGYIKSYDVRNKNFVGQCDDSVLTHDGIFDTI